MDDAQRASALAARFWDGLLEDAPLLGTIVADERRDDRLPDPSEAGRARRDTRARSALAELATIDRDALVEDERTTLDVLEAIAAREVAELTHRVDLLEAVSHLWGPAELLAEIGSYQRADTPERLERLLARLEAAPAYYAAVADVVREGVAIGVTAPRVVVERTLAQVERLLATPVEDSPAVQPVSPEDSAARERVAEAIRDHVAPALRGCLDTLRAYVPSATESIGLSALPGGDGI